MLTLYCESLFDSPFVFTVQVALKEKALPYTERVFVLAKGEHRTGEFAERSLTARVPALVHGDFWISESVAICEYLDEIFGPPLLMGESPAERARVRQVMGWLRTDLRELRAERPSESIFLGQKVAPMSPACIADRDRLVAIASRLLMPGQDFLTGKFSLADADLAFFLMRLIANADPVPEPLRAYVEAIWRRPSVQSFATHPRAAP